MPYRVKHIMEYGVLRGLLGLLRILPYRAALSIGWVLAGLAHHVFRYRVRRARLRIRSVFGDALSERAVRRCTVSR